MQISHRAIYLRYAVCRYLTFFSIIVSIYDSKQIQIPSIQGRTDSVWRNFFNTVTSKYPKLTYKSIKFQSLMRTTFYITIRSVKYLDLLLLVYLTRQRKNKHRPIYELQSEMDCLPWLGEPYSDCGEEELYIELVGVGELYSELFELLQSNVDWFFKALSRSLRAAYLSSDGAGGTLAVDFCLFTLFATWTSLIRKYID